MLQQLRLTHFRSYTDQTYDFNRLTVFVGPNGIGKTNILEAISYLALGRSWRTRQDKEAIHWGEEVGRLVGQTEFAAIEIVFGHSPASGVRGGKLIKINGVSRRAIELLGQLTVVLFLPESLSLIDGSPHFRRQFLDLLLIQRDRKYAYHLLQLQKVLRQRNRLLRQVDEGQAEVGQLVFWDNALIEHGSYLIAARVAALQNINKTLPKHYQTMSQQQGNLILEYKAAAVSQSSGDQQRFKEPISCPTKPEEWGELLARTLKNYQYREIAAGASLYGPQRDDIVFRLDGRLLASFGSRGEWRSAVLALKAAEADYLLTPETDTEERPDLLFLLDDVYSELDEGRRGQLAQLIGDHQAVITTTDLSHLDPTIRKEAKIIILGQTAKKTSKNS